MVLASPLIIKSTFAGLQSIVQRQGQKSKPFYFLTYPKHPNKSVVHEVMCRIVAAEQHKNMPFIQLVWASDRICIDSTA